MGIQAWFAEEMELQRKRDEEYRRSERRRGLALVAIAAVPFAMLVRGLWCLAACVDLPEYSFETTQIIWGADLVEGAMWLAALGVIWHLLGGELPAILRRGWHGLGTLLRLTPSM